MTMGKFVLGNHMKMMLRISLILLVGFLSLSVAPLVQSMPLMGDQLAKQQISESISETKNQCFSALDTDAAENCKNLINQDQSNPKIWNRLGHIYYGLENYEASYLSFKYAVSLDPEYATAWANVCAALNKFQKHEEALEACEKSLNISLKVDGSIDEKVLAWNNKAIALYSLARYQDSIDALDQALSLNPDDIHAMLNRIIILHVLDHRISSRKKELQS